MEDDQNLQLSPCCAPRRTRSTARASATRHELEDGFPAKAEELFAYQGLIIGSVEANYFTPAQQELIQEFANRRGGGVLFLGGRYALADGGWTDNRRLAELLPVRLPDRKDTFHRDPCRCRADGRRAARA